MKIRSYIQKSYKRQLQLYFIASSVIPIAVSGFLLVGLFRYQAQKDLSRQDLHRQDQIASILSDAFALSENGIREVAEDPDIAAALMSGKVQSHNVYAALYRKTGELRDFATADIYSGGKRIYSTGSGTESRTLPTDFGLLRTAAANPAFRLQGRFRKMKDMPSSQFGKQGWTCSCRVPMERMKVFW